MNQDEHNKRVRTILTGIWLWLGMTFMLLAYITDLIRNSI
jgi:hypothetical protein